jgi:predicted DNA binding CopG/RHH family protein
MNTIRHWNSEKKDKMVGVRLSETEFKKLQELSKAENMSISDFIRLFLKPLLETKCEK